jgi:hypothetical protein
LIKKKLKLYKNYIKVVDEILAQHHCNTPNWWLLFFSFLFFSFFVFFGTNILPTLLLGVNCHSHNRKTKESHFYTVVAKTRHFLPSYEWLTRYPEKKKNVKTLDLVSSSLVLLEKSSGTSLSFTEAPPPLSINRRHLQLLTGCVVILLKSMNLLFGISCFCYSQSPSSYFSSSFLYAVKEKSY